MKTALKLGLKSIVTSAVLGCIVGAMSLVAPQEAQANPYHIYISTPYAIPTYAAPAYGVTLYGGPVYGGPVYGGPVYGGPLYAPSLHIHRAYHLDYYRGLHIQGRLDYAPHGPVYFRW